MKRALALLAQILLLALGVAGAVVVFTGEQKSMPEKAGTSPQLTKTSTVEASAESEQVLRIGWTAWMDAEVVTRLAKRLLEERMGQEVRLTMADIGLQYQAVSSGDLDIMLMAWLPLTHQNYWKQVRDKVVNLGPLYVGARLGWVVPDYVPKAQLSSIADLRRSDVAKRVSLRVQGIDPGSGLMQASERAIDGYQLSKIDLVSASDAAMTAAISRAVQRKKWIVATAWSPHWMFAKWKLRYLKDPKHIFGHSERIHAIARRGFDQDFSPQIVGFFTRMFIPLPQLEETMLRASRESVESAVDWYIETHPERVSYWVTGKLSAHAAR